MSGILSSLPGPSRGFGPLPQLFHAEVVFSIPQRAGIKVLEAAQAQRVLLAPELWVFLPVLSGSSQINVLVFSHSRMQHPSLCRAHRNPGAWRGAALGFDLAKWSLCWWGWSCISSQTCPKQCEELFPLPALLLPPGWVFPPGIIWWLQPFRDVVTSWLGCPSAEPLTQTGCDPHFPNLGMN